MIKQDEMKGGVKLPELVEQLGMAVLNKGKDYENALVGIRDVNRPGLQLVGFFDYDRSLRRGPALHDALRRKKTKNRR